MPRRNEKRAAAASLVEEVEQDEVPEQIYNAVVGAILDRALDPGTKLPEDVFCSHYGVSRTIVRVAIHRLHYDKLVEIQRNRGCFVLVPSREEAIDILGGRAAIEPSIVRKVCEVATDGDIAGLRNHVDQEDDAYQRNDQRAALRLSGQFHLLLGQIAKNVCVEKFLHNLICRSALVIATYSDVNACCKIPDHRRLLDLIAMRDSKAAADHMSKHISHIERDLLQEKGIEDNPSLESVLAKYASSPVPPKQGRPVRPLEQTARLSKGSTR
jgi:DNA-binding GntR family transcriptional regulator